MRKNLFKSMLMAICCVSVFAFVACSDDNEKVNDTLKISPDKIEIVTEESSKSVISNGVAPYTVVVSDDDIVTTTVDKDSIFVTGVKKGSAIVTITDKNNFSGKITVTVKDAPELLIFDKEDVIIEGENQDVVTVQDGTAPYTVKVKDETIATATVNENKVTVKGVKTGTTTITVSDKDEKIGTINVTIK